VNPVLLQGLGDGNQAVPVGVGLDHSHDFRVFTHNRFDLPEIVDQSGKIDLKPVHSFERPVPKNRQNVAFISG
jgi:hypothetical protein